MEIRRILRRPAVLEATGLRTASLYEQIAAGKFPKPVAIGPRAVGWFEDEIAQWQLDRAAARDKKVA